MYIISTGEYTQTQRISNPLEPLETVHDKYHIRNKHIVGNPYYVITYKSYSISNKSVLNIK